MWIFQGLSATPATNLKKRVEPWQKRAGMPQDLNRYTYVMNNPIAAVDVDGYRATIVTEGTLGWFQKQYVHSQSSGIGAVIGGLVSHYLGFGVFGELIGALLGHTKGNVAGAVNVAVMYVISGLSIIAGVLVGSIGLENLASALINAGVSGFVGGYTTIMTGGSIADAWRAFGVGYGIGFGTGMLFDWLSKGFNWLKAWSDGGYVAKVAGRLETIAFAPIGFSIGFSLGYRGTDWERGLDYGGMGAAVAGAFASFFKGSLWLAAQLVTGNLLSLGLAGIVDAIATPPLSAASLVQSFNGFALTDNNRKIGDMASRGLSVVAFSPW